MSLLLDTHTFLWWVADDARLSRRAKKAIGDPERVVYFSPASAWEIATKHRIGRLSEARELLADLPGIVARVGFQDLPISTRHAVLAEKRHLGQVEECGESTEQVLSAV